MGLQLAIEALLVSPSFLYRIEPDPPPGTTRGLDGFEVASRLSYFLWSSMPDEELFARARDGTLRRPEELAAQVGRMLDDPQGRGADRQPGGAVAVHRQLAELSPDPDLFPEDRVRRGACARRCASRPTSS